MSTIIQVSHLNKFFRVLKHYRGVTGAIRNLFTRQHSIVRAVEDLSFQIERGEIVGYIGPNGAGKSTTLKVLTGLLVPTSGDVWVDGWIPWRDRQKYVAHIGAVFGQRTTLWWDLPVIESLELLREIYHIPDARFSQNMREFRKMLELDEFIRSPVRSLSLGQRMRADICAALLHNPKIVLLDEPTIGLDVVAKERIRQFIAHINQTRETTVILTTHDLADVEKLCERVMIIDRGRLLYDGDLGALKQRFGGRRKLIVDLAEHYEEIILPEVEITQHEGLRVVMEFSPQDTNASALIGKLSSRYHIKDLSVQEPDIETTIRRIYEERLLD